MIYRKFGQTGLEISAIGFGGMRFGAPDDAEASAALVRAAYDAGINYFDTAPLYGKSEELFGVAFKEMAKMRAARPFYVSTKTFAAEPSEIRRELETSLARMGLDYVDFYHVWCLMNPGEFAARRAKGVVKEFERLRDEGLIRHISVSSHMAGADIAAMMREYPFESVLLGYSPMNFAYREEGVAAAAALGRGVVVMNPLGGGIIPQHPERFDFVRTRPEETVVEGALRFLLNDARISCALIGFADVTQVAPAVRAVDGFRPLQPAQVEAIRGGLREAFDHMCTGCAYCEPCPEGLSIPRLMDAYNQFILSGKPGDILSRLKWHWALTPDASRAFPCAECGQCEARCTQRLPIVERLREIRAEVGRAGSAK